MERVSEETWRLVSRLLARVQEPATSSAELIDEIAARDEPGASLYLVPFLLSGRRGEAVAAARGLGRLVDGATPDTLVELTDAVHDFSRQDAPLYEPWRQLGPGQLGRLQMLPGSWAALGLASAHGSGYLREAALVALAALEDARVLPFLLLRLSDWVPQVRAVADRAVEARLTAAHADAWVDNLSILERMRRRRRVTLDGILARVTALLRDPACAPSLARGMASADRVQRRAAGRIRLFACDDPEILLAALASPDAAVRLLAAKGLRAIADPTRLFAAVQKAQHDSFLPVRREALCAAVERLGDASRPLVERALFDVGTPLRDYARFQLRRIAPSFDQAACYRQALQSVRGPRVGVALLGLSECGTREDQPLLASFLTHARPAIRRAAVRALDWMGSKTGAELLLPSLADAAPSVSRQAGVALATRLSLELAERVWPLLDGAPPHVERHAAQLFVALGGWPAVQHLLRLAANGSSEASELANQALRRWPSYARGRQPGDQRAALKATLERARPSLDAALYAELTAALADPG